MLVGYARVSTAEQRLELQTDALEAAGCERLYTDQASGASADRPGLIDALGYVREGDTLVVWRLDRLGRSLKDLVDQVEGLREKGVGFRSLTEGIDTTTPGGKLVFHIFASLAEFERALIRDRTLAGLQSARARGRVGGRPSVFDNPETVRLASKLLASGELDVDDVARTVGCKRSTLYRHFTPTGEPRSKRAKSALSK